jgi:hypothetical protein
VPLGAEHPLRVDAAERGPRPYIALDEGIEALIARPVYYEMAALAVPGPAGGSGVWSAGHFFSLEPAASEPRPRNTKNAAS